MKPDPSTKTTHGDDETTTKDRDIPASDEAATASETASDRNNTGVGSASGASIDSGAAVEDGETPQPAETGDEAVDIEALTAKIRELEAAQEENLKQMAALQDARLRLQAEFDNYRRRTRQEIETIRQNAAESVATQLLPVIDNFERALAAAGDDPKVAGFVQGVEMIYKQFLGVLGEVGVTPIPAEGVPFDPQVHEAVASEPRTDVDPGTVVEELRRGYTLNGKVIRVAMVKVAAAPADKEENDHE